MSSFAASPRMAACRKAEAASGPDGGTASTPYRDDGLRLELGIRISLCLRRGVGHGHLEKYGQIAFSRLTGS